MMDKTKKNLLEENEAIAILVGFMIGTSILALPNSIVQEAKQDGWIAILVGSIYPLYLALLAIYYVKSHPNQDILALSKIYLGKVLGTICNILFMVQFGIFLIITIVSLSNIFRVYATPFLTPIKIFIPTILLAMYLSNKGIKVLGKINVISLYTIVILEGALLATVKNGNHLNFFPIFETGVKNILSSSMESALAYGGIEAVFLIYPVFKEKNKIKNITLKAVFFTMAAYFWVTFICIYTLGYKVTSIALWPVLLATEAVNLPLLNSFRYLFLFLWSIVMFKIIANDQYVVMYILSDLLKIKNKKYFYWALFPVLICLCFLFKNEVQRRDFLGFVTPKITLFNIAYISIIAILIFIKHKAKK
ncbi:GerAB/ArcD/ProY family transporter [Clostridium sp.]|uniref:GerAB/ArcD/ProY family transporter n=1 Tax=Clostridium sp. TaxID=1506 RepID=UPI003D6D418B